EQNASDIAELDDQINNDGGIADRLGDAESAIADNTSAIEQNASDIADNADAIEGLDGRLSDAEGAIADNAAAIEQNASDIAALDSQINSNGGIMTRLDNAEGAIADNTAAIEQNAQDIASLAADMGSVSDLDADLQATTVVGAINEVHGLISDVSGDIENLQKRVTDVEEAIGDIDDLNPDLGDTLVAAANTLDNRLENVEEDMGDLADLETTANTIVDAINGLDGRVAENEENIGNMDFSSADNIEDDSDLTHAILALDGVLGDMGEVDGEYVGNGTVAEDLVALNDQVAENAENIGDIDDITAEYAQNADDSAPEDLATAINNVANNAYADIHGEGEGSSVEIGDNADTIIIGKSHEDTQTPPETEILAGMSIDTVEREVEIAAVDGDSVVGADFSAKDETVTVSAGNDDTTTGLKLNNKEHSITLTSSDDDNATGLTIDNDDQTVTLGTNGDDGSYTLEVNAKDGTTTIGDGEDKVVIGKGTVDADKSITVAENAVVAEVDEDGKGNVTATGTITGDEVVAQSGFTLGDTRVTAIDTDGSHVSADVEQATRQTMLATVETVYAGAENANYTPDDDAYTTAESATLGEAINALDATLGDMDNVNGTYAKTGVVATDLAAIDGVLGDVEDLTGNAEGSETLVAAINATNGVIGDIDDLQNTFRNMADAQDAEPETIVAALDNLDASLGAIKALKTDDYSNLADEGSAAVEHFKSLDSAIGDRTNDYKNDLNGEGKSNGYVATGSADKDIVSMISEVASNIGTASDIASTNYISSERTVNANLSALDAELSTVNASIGNISDLHEDLGTDLTSAINAVDSKVTQSNRVFSNAISKLDHNYRELRHDFEAGMAGQAALSALVPNAKASGSTQLAVGTGAYKGHTAAAVGGFHWFTDNLLFNAGVAWDNNEATGRMGITYSW
ncbi:MAG: YadA-like family protein, partial [Alphaproteobacteria bacterium]|nr:YadA-like family protein [Alphaproteobacteria bacterium]